MEKVETKGWTSHSTILHRLQKGAALWSRDASFPTSGVSEAKLSTAVFAPQTSVVHLGPTWTGDLIMVKSVLLCNVYLCFSAGMYFFFPAKSVNTKSGASADSYEQSAFSICELAEMRVTVFRHIWLNKERGVSDKPMLFPNKEIDTHYQATLSKTGFSRNRWEI